MLPKEKEKPSGVYLGRLFLLASLTDSPAHLHAKSASEAQLLHHLGVRGDPNSVGTEPGCPLSVVSGVGEVGTELGIALPPD